MLGRQVRNFCILGHFHFCPRRWSEDGCSPPSIPENLCLIHAHRISDCLLMASMMLQSNEDGMDMSIIRCKKGHCRESIYGKLFVHLHRIQSNNRESNGKNAPTATLPGTLALCVWYQEESPVTLFILMILDIMFIKYMTWKYCILRVVSGEQFYGYHM